MCYMPPVLSDCFLASCSLSFRFTMISLPCRFRCSLLLVYVFGSSRYVEQVQYEILKMFGTKTISWCIFRCGRRAATTPLSGFATSQGQDHMKSGVSDQEKWRGLIISWICGALFVLIMIDQKARKLWPSSLQVCTSAEGRSEQAVFRCSLFSCWHGICILPPCPVCHRAYFYCIFGSSIRSRWSIHPLASSCCFLIEWVSNRLQNGV